VWVRLIGTGDSTVHMGLLEGICTYGAAGGYMHIWGCWRVGDR
jgi:hypothetical protein